MLQREHVDLAFTVVRDVEPLYEFEHAKIRPLGPDDDDRIAPIVGHNLGDVHIATRARGCGLARRGRSPRLEVEDLVQARDDIARNAVVNGLNPDLVADAPNVEVLQDAHHALNVGPGVRDDEQIARPVDRDVTVLGFEMPEHARNLFGARVAKPMKARDVTLLPGARLTGHVNRGTCLGVGLIDDLVEAPVGHHGEPVGLEDRQEGLVRLGDGDFLR
jgi:hypothetical protein